MSRSTITLDRWKLNLNRSTAKSGCQHKGTGKNRLTPVQQQTSQLSILRDYQVLAIAIPDSMRCYPKALQTLWLARLQTGPNKASEDE